MNDSFRDLKARVRHLDSVLAGGAAANVDFAQALSQVHRVLRRGDRSREPTAELEALVHRAEALAPRRTF